MIAVLAALALAQAQDDPHANLDELRQIYQTSCADRDFYTFNDVCNQIEAQVRQAEIAVDRADRRKPPAPKPTAPAAPKGDTPTSPAAPSAKDIPPG